MSRLLKPTVLLALIVAGSLVGLSVARDWTSVEPVTVSVTGSAAEISSPAPNDEIERRIGAFCGDCHAVPDPANFPPERWHQEVKKGYEFYARSGRQDLDPPPLNAVLQYYLAKAPESPIFPAPTEATTPLGTSFQVEKRFVPPQATLPEISYLSWLPLGPDGKHFLVACDMQYGQIVAMDPNDADAAPQILARLEHPAHLQLCSLSDDGSTELLVADLGGYKPADHDRGRVVLLKRAVGASEFEEIVLVSGLGRVADVRATDVDQDGRQDFIVAEFGWHDTGGIWLFQNVSSPNEPLRFARRRIDGRPGTIHVPVADFDNDGYPDFAALVSQEFEAVELFLNATKRQPTSGLQRHSAFDRYNVWSGPDLTFGSSGLQVSDLNGNGRMDLLFTSGDAWDNDYASPSHGVHWLENQGDLRFQYHRLTHMPGAYAATPCDVDGDQDLDVIAVSWLPPQVQPASLAEHAPLASIVCLEQTEPGLFVRHTLEVGSAFYSSVAVGDFDQDGDIDFAVGSGPQVAENRSEKFYLAIWWNQTTSPE